jgi:hypothetical protein
MHASMSFAQGRHSVRHLSLLTAWTELPPLQTYIRKVTAGEFIPAMKDMDMGTARGLQAAEAKARG